MEVTPNDEALMNRLDVIANHVCGPPAEIRMHAEVALRQLQWLKEQDIPAETLREIFDLAQHLTLLNVAGWIDERKAQ